MLLIVSQHHLGQFMQHADRHTRLEFRNWKATALYIPIPKKRMKRMAKRDGLRILHYSQVSLDWQFAAIARVLLGMEGPIGNIQHIGNMFFLTDKCAFMHIPKYFFMSAQASGNRFISKKTVKHLNRLFAA